MTLSKGLKWGAVGAMGLFALAYATTHVVRWNVYPTFETTLLFSNQSGQALRNVEIAHNGEVVFKQKLLTPGENIVLAGLDPFRGPRAQPRRGDVYGTEATGAIAFARDPDGKAERHEFSAGGHSEVIKVKCLFVVSITSESVKGHECTQVQPLKRQATPKGE